MTCKICEKEVKNGKAIYCCKEHRELDYYRYAGEEIEDVVKRRSGKCHNSENEKLS